MRQSKIKRFPIQPGTGGSLRRLPAVPVVAIVGATGAVGAEMVACLEQRYFPLSALRLYASARSAGKTMSFIGDEIPVEELSEASFAGVDVALFSASATVSRHFAPIAAREGAVVVDNSSAFRMDPAVPLVVPEVNAETIAGHGGIIANPNCVVIIAAVALWPIHRKNRIRRLTLTTYQAASGAGAAAMEELRESTRAYLDGRAYANRVLPHDYAFNLFSHNTSIDRETGYNGEETKVMNETRKIFGDPELRITATCVRVPVLRAHAMSLSLECEQPIDPDEVRSILDDAPGVRVVDDVANNRFPMPKDASGQGDVLVGRIRRDASDPTGRSVMMFAAGDQLLKGAALNAVQIAEQLMPRPKARPAAAVPLVERMGVL
ncbi:MAG: aspartate-semialdehyde dehydrogenase [Alphaproteobacteria bacterium]|nr:aspartate-semialdehyde dehydrogenase [Alphaproteobacteria bacterium]